MALLERCVEVSFSTEFDTIERSEARSAAARSIFNEVEDWRGTKRAVASRRWMWELLQNAKDSAHGRPFSFSVVLSANALTVRHDAGPFQLREIVALVEGDSSKHRRIEDITGRFGKGFLVSHVLSTDVSVKGVLRHEVEGDHAFTFRLRRNGSEEVIRQNILECRDALDHTQPHPGGPCITEFVYTVKVNDEIWSCVFDAFTALRNHAPYLFAFIRELKDITFELPHEPKSVFSTTVRGPINTQGVPAEVEKVTTATPDGPRHVLLFTVPNAAANARPKVAFEIDGRERIRTPNVIARVFQDLPLYATAHFDIPIVINLPSAADVDSDRAAPNVTKVDTLKAIGSALALLPFVVNWAVRDSKHGVHLLAEFGISEEMNDEPDSASKWAIPIKETLKQLIACRLVECAGGEFRKPEDVLFPDSVWLDVAGSDNLLLSGTGTLLALRGDAIPDAESLEEWEMILAKWKTLGPVQYVRRIGLKNLFEQLQSAGTLKLLQQRYPLRFGSEDAAVSYIAELFHVAAEYCDRHKVAPGADLTRAPVVLNQAGVFREGPVLSVDAGVDAALKQVSADLGVSFKDRLVDARLSGSNGGALVTQLCGGKIFYPRNAIGELINHIDRRFAGGQSKGPEAQALMKAAARLMAWLGGNQKFAEEHDLRSFPVACADGKLHVLAEHHDRFVLPAALISEGDQQWVGIFPAYMRVSDLYLEMCDAQHVPRSEFVHLLTRNHLAGASLLIDRDLSSDADHFSAMYVNPKSEQGHRIEKLEVKDISGFSRLLSDTGGVSASGNDSEARKVLEFVLSYAVKQDSSWKRRAVAVCTARHSCSKAVAVYPSSWLGRLKTSRWVPSAERGGQPEPLSNRNVHDLLDVLSSEVCGSPEAREFLAIHFGVDRLEMALRAKAGDDPELIAQLKNDWAAVVDSGIDPAIVAEYVTRHKAAVEITTRNGKLGRMVELLVAEAFEKQGFLVERTGIGSDFKVSLVDERDPEAGEEEVGELKVVATYQGTPVEFLVEIKATREPVVRMSWKQADTAAKSVENYVLCVVDFEGHSDLFDRVLEENRPTCAVINGCIGLVPRIGEHLAACVGSLTSAVQTSTPAIQVERADEIRFRISRPVWRNGPNLAEWAASVKAKVAGSEAAATQNVS